MVSLRGVLDCGCLSALVAQYPIGIHSAPSSALSAPVV